MSEPVAWIKDTSLIALKRDESTVMAYPHDYLIRPAVPLYAAPPATAAPARLTDEEIDKLAVIVDQSVRDSAWAGYFASLVEAEVLRRMGVVG